MREPLHLVWRKTLELLSVKGDLGLEMSKAQVRSDVSFDLGFQFAIALEVLKKARGERRRASRVSEVARYVPILRLFRFLRYPLY